MTIVRNFLMFVEVVVSILLIVVVVLQTSKSAGMGAVGGSNDSFGGKERGLDGFLSKCTIYLAIIFGVFSLWLGIYLNHY